MLRRATTLYSQIKIYRQMSNSAFNTPSTTAISVDPTISSGELHLSFATLVQMSQYDGKEAEFKKMFRFRPETTLDHC
jgi:hypothetical protein